MVAVQELLEKASALHQAGQLQEAIALYQQAIALEPQNPVPYNLTGALALQIGRADIAESMYKRSLSLEPRYQEAHYNYGNLLYAQKRFAEAESSYRMVIESCPLYTSALNNLANVLRETGREDEAISLYRKAAERQPDFARAWENLGKACSITGNLTEATAAYERAIEIDPALMEAYFGLARMTGYPCTDDFMRRMRGLLGSEMTDEQRILLHFALGNACRKRKEYDDAFAFWLEGNRLHRQRYHYDSKERAQYFSQIKNAFASPPPGWSWQEGLPDDTPIFILGMPRSGTTLVEQILSSHPKVHGAGELSIMASLVKPLLQEASGYALTATDRQRFGEQYVRELRQHGPEGIAHITPKMPDNFKLIGYIAAFLPNARIIHCRRDPLDTCLSIFSQYFVEGHGYAYNLTEIGEYYRMYEDLMAFWHALLPGRIYDIRYEEVVENFEPTARALLAHCNLEWDERCVSFHKNKRVVRTASDAQVRQPLYKSSMRIHDHYTAHIGPLRQALGMAA